MAVHVEKTYRVTDGVTIEIPGDRGQPDYCKWSVTQFARLVWQRWRYETRRLTEFPHDEG